MIFKQAHKEEDKGALRHSSSALKLTRNKSNQYGQTKSNHVISIVPTIKLI